jgi:hypothetical protein
VAEIASRLVLSPIGLIDTSTEIDCSHLIWPDKLSTVSMPEKEPYDCTNQCSAGQKDHTQAYCPYDWENSAILFIRAAGSHNGDRQNGRDNANDGAKGRISRDRIRRWSIGVAHCPWILPVSS